MQRYIEEIWGRDQQWQENDFAKHFEPENITVVLAESELIGYAQVERQNENLFIRMLLLSPEHQRKGVGTLLLEQVLKVAANQSLGVQLQVFKINESAKLFYERHGFRVESETPTSLVMAKNA